MRDEAREVQIGDGWAKARGLSAWVPGMRPVWNVVQQLHPLASDMAAQAVSGSFAFSVARGRPFLRVSDLAMTVGDASYRGKGAMGSDGRLYLDFSDGLKQMRVGATLSPFQVELLPVGGPGGR